jgi:hypothetical protein
MTYLVSASDEIRHPASLIARFLRTEFPVLADLASDFEQQIHGAKTLAPSDAGSDYPWSLVGTAIDYRLRFLFEILPVTRLQAFQAAQGWHISDAGTVLDEQVTFPMGPNSRRVVSMAKVSADLFSELRDFLRRVRPARRYLSRDDEAWLCRYCAALALIDRKLTGKLRTGEDPLHALPAGSTLEDVFALIPRAAIVDICQLSRRFQTATGREWLKGTVKFNPSVWVGNIGASPDLLVGDCLLDLKTATRPRLERVWLDQLLLYTLVVGDLKKIIRLGFHLLRQDRTITWPIDEFLTQAAGGSEVDIERLSQEFFTVAAHSSFMSPMERRKEPK